jgi:hypothetical protein
MENNENEQVFGVAEVEQLFQEAEQFLLEAQELLGVGLHELLGSDLEDSGFESDGSTDSSEEEE